MTANRNLPVETVRIVLHGRLRQQFGREFRFGVTTPASGLRVMMILLPGFREAIAEGQYRIRRGSYHKGVDLSPAGLQLRLPPGGEMHIIPVASGRKNGGTGKFIAGAVIMVAAIALAQPEILGALVPMSAGETAFVAAAGATGMSGMLFGASLVGGFTIGSLALLGGGLMLSGIAGMLAGKTPQQVVHPQSYLLSGQLNVVTQGAPVPVVYGRMMVGSVVISMGYEAEDWGTTAQIIENAGAYGAGGSVTQVDGGVTKNSGATGASPTGSGGGGGKGVGGSVGTATEAPDTLRSKAVVRIIDVLSEGPIGGLVNGAQSIYFGNTPLLSADGTWHFQGVAWTLVTGNPEQDPVPGFPSSESSQSINLQAFHAIPLQQTINSPGATAARVTVQIPALYYLDSNGKVNQTDLAYTIEMRPRQQALPGWTGSWTTVANVQINGGKCVSPYQRSHRFTLPTDNGADTWDIRLTRLTADANNSPQTNPNTPYLANELWWFALDTITDHQLMYPNTALIALAIDSVSFGSTVPPRNYELDGRLVQVPQNYDAAARTYASSGPGTTGSTWDLVSMQPAVTSNPCWNLLDMLSSSRYGCGISDGFLQTAKADLYNIAQYCDALVPDGYGGTEPRWQLNAVIANQYDAYQLLQMMVATFRGMTYWGAGQVNVSADMPRAPVKLVNQTNVLNGQFDYQGTSLKTRHNLVRVAWLDPENSYQIAYEQVSLPLDIAKRGVVPYDYTAWGCTSRSHAHRIGKWLLYTENNQTETVEYKAGPAHIDARPGDTIQIADPAYAGARMGGRLKPGGATVSWNAPGTSLDLDFMAQTYSATGVSANASTFGGIITFSRASTATYFDASGVLQEAAADEPRFDHDPATGQPLGLLIEEARTNQIRNPRAEGVSTGGTAVAPPVAPSLGRTAGSGGVLTYYVKQSYTNASGETAVSAESSIAIGVDTPAAPALTAVAGTASAAATYYVRASYVNPLGETLASTEASAAVGVAAPQKAPSTTLVAGDDFNYYYFAVSYVNALGETTAGPTSGLKGTGVSSSPQPATLGSVAGGAIPATTYYVKLTYSSLTGETTPSSETSIAVAANALLTVASPSTAARVTGGWNVYVGTAPGNETKQNGAPIALGTGWTLPLTGLVSDGAAPPTSNTAGNFLQVASPPASGDATGWNLYAGTDPSALTKQNSAPLGIGEAWTQTAVGMAGSGAPPTSSTALGLLQVGSPPASGDATGWNVYVGTGAGAETKQNSAPIAIGTAWTEPSGGLISGTAPPAASTAFGLLTVASPAAATDVTGWNLYVGTGADAETKQNSAPIAIGTGWTLPSTGLVAGDAPPSASTIFSAGGFPTDWAHSEGSGVAPVVVGDGTEDGIPYVDVRWQGTTTAVGNMNLFLETLNPAASPGQQWTVSVYVRIVAGSFANLQSFSVLAGDNGSTQNHQNGPGTPTDAPLKTQRFDNTFTVSSGATTVGTVGIQVTNIATGPIDITLRIGAPQLEQGAWAGSVILPPMGSPGASTRQADNVQALNSTGWMNASAQSLSVEFSRLTAVSDGTGHNAGVVAITDSAYDDFLNLFDVSRSAGLESGTYIGTLASAAADHLPIADTGVHRYAFALAAASGAASLSVDGGAPTTATVSAYTPPALDRIMIGQGRFPGSALNGYIRRLKYWPENIVASQLQAAASNTTALNLDAVFTPTAGETYTISVVMPDGTVELDVPVSSFASAGATPDYTVATLSRPLKAVPTRHAEWIIKSSALAPRQFQVLSLGEDSKLAFTVAGVNYDPNKFAWIEDGIKFDDTPFSQLPGLLAAALPAPSNVTAQDYMTGVGVTQTIRVTVSWTAPVDPRIISFDVMAAAEDGSYQHTWNTGTVVSSYDIDTLDSGKAYTFAVRSVGRNGAVSAWTTVSVPVQVDGKVDTPAAPDALTAVGGTRRIQLTWDAIANRRDILSYEVWRSNGSGSGPGAGASRIATVAATSYLDAQGDVLLPNTTWYYWVRGVALPSVDGAYAGPVNATTTLLVADDIQDGILNTAKFAASVAAPVIIANIAATTDIDGNGVTVGQYAVNEADHKLYRYAGSGSWTPVVNTTDLSGQITSAQIVSLLASQISGQLTDTQIAALSAAKLTGTITTTQITDGAISTPKLAAGAVDTNALAAGAVTASNLAVGSPTNVIWNGCCPLDTSGWTYLYCSQSGVTASVSALAVGSAWRLVGYGSGNLTSSATLSANQFIDGGWDPDSANGVPCNPGDSWAFSAAMMGNASIASVQLIIQFWDGSGNPITGATIQTVTVPLGGAAAATLAAYAVGWAKATAPANAARVKGWFRVYGNGSGSASLVFTQAQLGLTNPNATGPAPWQPGGVTTITGGVIASDTIESRHLVAGSVTAGALAADSVTANAIAGSTITGDKIAGNTITGSNLVANTITAGLIAAGAISTTQLAAGAVKATNLASETLITQSVQIGNGVIDTIHIGDAQITTAKIGSLQVGTGNIANSAVSNIATASGSNSVSVSITGDGASAILIWGLAQVTSTAAGELGGTSFAQATLTRDGATLQTASEYGQSSASAVSIPFAYLDYAPSGSHTYTIAGTSGTSGAIVITAMKMMK